MSLATVAAICVSLAALAHLAAGDPKRRRAFRLPASAPRRTGLIWAVALVPGLLVPLRDGAGGFFVWLGAVAVLGWVLAAVSPDRSAAMLHDARTLILQARGRVEPLLRSAGEAGRRLLNAGPDRHLAERVAELEREVAALRARLAVATGAPDVVVELPRTGEPLRSSRQG